METFFNTYGFLIVTMLFSACLGLSLYLPLMTGQLSLASPAFYALGGYVAAIMSSRVFPNTVTGTLFPLPYLVIEVFVAAALCAVVALAIGLPTLRLRGIYLALATIALVEVVRILAVGLTDITNGSLGINNIPQPIHTVSRFEYSFLVGPLLIFSMWVVYRLERSRIGRAFTAIREDELAASAIGINVTYYKVMSFILGAMLAGVVGALSAHFYINWNEKYGTFDLSILILAYALVGGSRTFLGPVVGGMVLTALPEVLRQFAGLASSGPTNLPAVIGPVAGVMTFPAWLDQVVVDGRLVLFGLLIAAGAIFFPQGLITPDLYKRFKRGRVQAQPQKAEPKAVPARVQMVNRISLILAIVLLLAFLILPWLVVSVDGATSSLSGVQFLLDAQPILKGGLPTLVLLPIAALVCGYFALRNKSRSPRWLAITAGIGLIYYGVYLIENSSAVVKAASYVGLGFYVGLAALIGLIGQFAVTRMGKSA